MTMSQPADDDGFDAFYSAEAELVVRFLLTMGAAVTDAVDAAGLAFIAVRGRWGQLTDPYSQVRRIAISHLDGSADPPPDADLRAFRACWATDFILLACERDDVRQMLAAFRRLPRREREILAWHRDGYATDEIAELLGMELTAVKQRLLAATEKIQQLGPGDLNWP
jgi:DNA-directed RNA polymerase specialized sigma24 family protein